MGENQKIQSLVNDTVRRMGNTSELVDIGVRQGVVDNYGQKLLDSGYTLQQTRRILISGLKGYERKLWESRQPGGKPFHQNSGESSTRRRLKKLTGKSNWFRQKKDVEAPSGGQTYNEEFGGGHERGQRAQVGAEYKYKPDKGVAIVVTGRGVPHPAA